MRWRKPTCAAARLLPPFGSSCERPAAGGWWPESRDMLGRPWPKVAGVLHGGCKPAATMHCHENTERAGHHATLWLIGGSKHPSDAGDPACTSHQYLLALSFVVQDCEGFVPHRSAPESNHGHRDLSRPPHPGTLAVFLGRADTPAAADCSPVRPGPGLGSGAPFTEEVGCCRPRKGCWPDVMEAAGGSGPRLSW
jgi:hypothetical protein